MSLFQILFIIHIFNEDPSICTSSSSILPTCHGTFHTMLLAAALGRSSVSCTVAANDFQKISWCGCSVSENWKIPQVRKDPSPLICLKVTLLIFSFARKPCSYETWLLHLLVADFSVSFCSNSLLLFHNILKSAKC